MRIHYPVGIELRVRSFARRRAEDLRTKEAYEKVEDEGDEHLYHTKGWCRELWFGALGFEAALPPPEEVRDVRTAVDAAEVEGSRQ